MQALFETRRELSMCKYEYNIKKYSMEIGCEGVRWKLLFSRDHRVIVEFLSFRRLYLPPPSGTDSSESEQSPVTDSCELGDERSSFHKWQDVS
jgi:hypothetical protein